MDQEKRAMGREMMIFWCPKYEDFPDCRSGVCERGFDMPRRRDCYSCGYNEGREEGYYEGRADAEEEMEDSSDRWAGDPHD